MRRLPFFAVTSVLAAFSGTACSSASESPAPTSPTPAAEQPAAKPAPETATPVEEKPVEPPYTPSFPQVESLGGNVMKKPNVIPIVFPGDGFSAQIEDFTKKLAGSKYWDGVAPEYGVGPLTAGTKITLTEAAPTTITSEAIEAWLKERLSGASPAFGAPDDQNLYAIFYPATTTITMDGAGDQGKSCIGYGGYHSEISVGGKSVGYAVLPRCSDIDDLTVATSHEIYEWATDPFPMTAPAFAKLDDDHWSWQVAMIGELSDLCTYLDQDNLKPTELGYTVQRHWSNKLSLAGKHPCAPQKNIAYTQAVPETNTTLEVPSYNDPNKTLKTQAIMVDPGKTAKVKVHVYSDQPTTTAVKISERSLEEFRGTQSTTGFKFSVGKSANVGDTVDLTIQAPKDPSYDVVVMFASPDGGRAWHFWPVTVTNSAGGDPGIGVGGTIPRAIPRTPSMWPKSNLGGKRFTQLGLSAKVRALP